MVEAQLSERLSQIKERFPDQYLELCQLLLAVATTYQRLLEHQQVTEAQLKELQQLRDQILQTVDGALEKNQTAQDVLSKIRGKLDTFGQDPSSFN